MKNVTDEQRDRLEALRERDPDLTVEWNDDQGVAARVRGELTRGEEPTGTVREFLEEFGLLFGPPDLAETLAEGRTRTDDLDWTHLEYRQLYDRERELELEGATLAAHVDADGRLVEVQSSCWRDLDRVDPDPSVEREALAERLDERIRGAPGYGELREQRQQRSEWPFPVMQEPRLLVYPWEGGFRLAWRTITYERSGLGPEGPSTPEDPSAEGQRELVQGRAYVDAHSGELFVFAPFVRGAETPDTGTGLAVTPLGGPFTTRNLNVVREDDTSTYRLKDTTHGRDIVTYDLANSFDYNTDSEKETGLRDGTLPVSEDADGDKSWDRTPSDTSVSERTASQQPEVDAHHFAREAYEWYESISGGTRVGWDDGQYADPPVPDQTISVLAHVRDGGNPSSINAGMRLYFSNGTWISWLQYYDGDATTYDYLAGSKFIVGHEYQHAVTDFSFEDSGGDPGLQYSGWLAAVHEGLSDVFGALFVEDWTPAQSISPTGEIFRNLAYPRDSGAFDGNNYDHFADRGPGASTFLRYRRGTILGHGSFLMGAGGVHERAARTPTLIPVYGVGGAFSAARIWYRALSVYLSTHGTATGVPSNDESVFRTIRSACVSAAQDLFGPGSLEHRNTVLTFYALGLHPTGEEYGADPTFLRWGASWRRSKPYVGVSSPDWSSVDLFVNNGGASEWNAQVNVTDASGDPTQFENDVYCRVRNVGDVAAEDVTVEFEYAKAGTGVASWQPVRDADGNPQTLTVGTLGPGESNFPDAAQDSPPASARVKWDIPPQGSAEVVDHYCLRATVSASNDVNVHNNEVQSNIQYVPYTPAASLVSAFNVGNPTEAEIPLDLRLDPTLPEGWRVRIPEELEDVVLEPGEERPVELEVEMPEGSDERLEPPFDGRVRGELFGTLTGAFTGTLTETTWDGDELHGRLGLVVENVGRVAGEFVGELDVETGAFEGRIDGELRSEGRAACGRDRVCTGVRGCLRPLRRIDVGQFVDDEPLGGVTVQVQVPLPEGPCRQRFPDLPPTGTEVSEGEPTTPEPEEPHEPKDWKGPRIHVETANVETVNVYTEGECCEDD
jgi:Zn-dependent metalloprotease